MLNTIKSFINSEWGRRIGWTAVTTSILALAVLGPALFVNWGMGALALVGLVGFFAKFDDIRLRSWRRPVAALAAIAGGFFMLYSGYAGYELLNRIAMSIGSFVILVIGSANTSKFLEEEVRKELKDD